MPSNIFGALPEKIIFAARRPEPFQLIFQEAAVLQRIGGAALGVSDDFPPVQRVVQTTV